ncbi:hypothetical protein [Caballeronia insecticola]|nr:hypothetical protein [Caballeronia insecticola]
MSADRSGFCSIWLATTGQNFCRSRQNREAFRTGVRAAKIAVRSEFPPRFRVNKSAQWRSMRRAVETVARIPFLAV